MSKKWFIPFLLIIIVVLLSYFAIDLYNHSTEDNTCKTPGSGQGMGQGRSISQTYLFLLVGSIIFILCVAIPLSYLLLSRNVKRQIEKNTSLITEIVNKNNTKPKDDDATSSKILFLKFLSFAENKVIKKLIENNGTIMQSEISRMDSMGKVRTHRVITELKKKEIVTVEPYGKTNRIILTDDAKNVLLK